MTSTTKQSRINEEPTTLIAVTKEDLYVLLNNLRNTDFDYEPQKSKRLSLLRVLTAIETLEQA